MIAAQTVMEACRNAGYLWYTGVPCSFFAPLLDVILNQSDLQYMGATSEGEALAISAGVTLGGFKSMTLCQNSGFGNLVNPLTSLSHPFRIPSLLIVTWRGQPGTGDAPQHDLMGRNLHRLLDALETPWMMFPESEQELVKTIESAGVFMTERGVPVVLIMKRGCVAPVPPPPTESPGKNRDAL